MRELMAQIGLNQHVVADLTGISRRRIQYLLAGSRTFLGQVQTVILTYPEQFILECLAEDN
jgi:transcriptional regulator with XRE-family HTH domain